MTSQNQTTKSISQLEAEAAGALPICFILARKGSKRLKNKNKLMLNGKPLIKYAIDTAKSSEIFQGVVVSSDDMEILEIAYESKCLCHQRPAGLAGDKVQMKQVVKFLMEAYAMQGAGCLMSPCNPMITSCDLKAGYELFKEKKANYVMSVKEAKPNPAYACYIEKGCLNMRKLERSQKYPKMYYADGGFIFFNPGVFIREFDFGFYGSRNYAYITPHMAIDIDTQDDFDLASKIMEAQCAKTG